MAIFERYLPPRRDAGLLFAACAFPIYVWCIINVLREVPAWILRLSMWELVGVISYALALALLETTVIWLALVVLSVVLPARVFRSKLVALGSVVVFVTAGWAVGAHYNAEHIRLWGMTQFSLWAMVYLASVAVVYALTRRSKRVEKAIRAVVERLSILAPVYVLVSLASILVIVVRNV